MGAILGTLQVWYTIFLVVFENILTPFKLPFLEGQWGVDY